jgi:hypothetical protein
MDCRRRATIPALPSKGYQRIALDCDSGLIHSANPGEPSRGRTLESVSFALAQFAWLRGPLLLPRFKQLADAEA